MIKVQFTYSYIKSYDAVFSVARCSLVRVFRLFVL